jgi:hypothetical protein
MVEIYPEIDRDLSGAYKYPVARELSPNNIDLNYRSDNLI